MTFLITNGFEQHLINLVHTFEPRLTINEQLPLIEKKTKFNLEEYFPFIYKLPYGFNKISHHFDSKNAENLFFVLDIHKFVVLRSFENEFPLLLKLYQEHYPNVKIAFLPTTYYFHEYVNKNYKSEAMTINVVDLLRYFKKSIQLTQTVERYLKESKISFLKINDIIVEFNKIKYMQLKSFLGYGHNFCCKFTPPALQYKKIKNYEEVLNKLSNTEYSMYLK
jgi:hypothetical protein